MHNRSLILFAIFFLFAHAVQAVPPGKAAVAPSLKGCWVGTIPQVPFTTSKRAKIQARIWEKKSNAMKIDLVFNDDAKWVDILALSDKKDQYSWNFSCDEDTPVECRLDEDMGGFKIELLKNGKAQLQPLGRFQIDVENTEQTPIVQIRNKDERSSPITLSRLAEKECEKKAKELYSKIESEAPPK